MESKYTLRQDMLVWTIILSLFTALAVLSFKFDQLWDYLF